MGVRIDDISTAAYTIPTDRPEADGTLAWDRTTIVLALAQAGGETGMGYTYADAATARLIDTLKDAVIGLDAMDIPACWQALRQAARNLGTRGQAAAAIAAIDTALWDLKARLFGLPLADLMGKARQTVPVYGSGGFTTYDERELKEQIAGWRDQGIGMAKIKIGGDAQDALTRMGWAREVLGDAPLFVDANGAFGPKQALAVAESFPDLDVTWFEEPVSSDDLEGLTLIRERAPAGTDITAGEYGWDTPCFRRMLEAGAVDVLQIDATRCQGYSGFIVAAALAQAWHRPVSSHCAPALHLPVCCHVPNTVHMEYFHDHARIESRLFDGVPPVRDGRLAPDGTSPGNGLTLRSADAQRYAA